MRISPNHPRLRTVALACWAIGAFCVVQGGTIVITPGAFIAMTISMHLFAVIVLAIGVAFWLLGHDQRAGIVFDGKGLLLNLGHSSSFIAWENIERVGVSTYRSSLLSLGSHRQLGIKLRDTLPYVQSYEDRLPATSGVFASGLRLLDGALRPFRSEIDRPLVARLAANRLQTGFDVLVPEAFLGGRADVFAELVDAYRVKPEEQRKTGAIAWAR